MIFQLQRPALKGCWSQDESELTECTAHDECLLDTRKTESKDRTAKFCCCRTHNCNKVLKYNPEQDPGTMEFKPGETRESSDEREDREAYMTIILCIAIILFAILCLISLVVFGVIHFRRKRSNEVKEANKFDSSTSNAISLGRLDYNRECMALIGNKLEDLRKIDLVEVN